MKKVRLLHFGIGILMLMLVFAPSAFAANTTFTLNIPSRGAKVAVGKVRITLELSGAPAGSQLIVAGETVSLPGIKTLVSGDKVLFTSEPTTNTVTIFYEPKGQFADPTNFCSLKAGMTGEQTIAMTLTTSGAVSVQAYRINSYTVPKELATDEGTCSQVFRRVKSNSATLTGLSGSVVNKGRHPLDVLLVLDQSNSMNWKPEGEPYSTKTRWQILKDSLGQFVSLWEQADMTSTGGGGLAEHLEKDRFGLELFDHESHPHIFTETGDIFRSRGTNPPGPTHYWQDIVTALTTSANVNGWTSIGAGLNEVISRWSALPEWKNDATIVLMTDGEQNRLPLVTTGPDGTLQLDPDNTGPESSRNLYTWGIPIQAIGFGTPATVEHTLLEKMSRQTAGASFLAVKSSDLPGAFENALVESLKGNTLSLISRNQGTITAANPSSLQIPATVDASIKRMVYTLNWQNKQNALGLKIYKPAGTNITPIAKQDGSYWTVQSVDIPQSGPTGIWKVKVEGSNLLPGENIPYQLSVFAVEERLDYRFTFPKKSIYAGEPIILRASIFYDDMPVKNLGSSIHVRVEGPKAGLGNILSESNVQLDTPVNTTLAALPSKDAQSPYQRKINYLISKTDLLQRIEPQLLGETYTMRDDGSSTSGDTLANDAIYGFKYTNTLIPGLYRFIVTMDWDDPRTGRIYRSEKLEKVVSVMPDIKYSVVNITRGPKPDEVMAVVTLQDQHGNILGPGYTENIRPSVSNGRISQPIMDPSVTGNYQVLISGVTKDASPILALQYDGKSIGQTAVNPEIPDNKCKRFSNKGSSALVIGMFMVGIVSLRIRRKQD